MVFSKSDTENLIAVFSDFRSYFNTELGNAAKSYLLTLDVHSMPIWYLNKNQLTRLTPLLDWYNLMTYEASVLESMKKMKEIRITFLIVCFGWQFQDSPHFKSVYKSSRSCHQCWWWQQETIHIGGQFSQIFHGQWGACQQIGHGRSLLWSQIQRHCKHQQWSFPTFLLPPQNN